MDGRGREEYVLEEYVLEAETVRPGISVEVSLSSLERCRAVLGFREEPA
jgi:hypothetical protein